MNASAWLGLAPCEQTEEEADATPAAAAWSKDSQAPSLKRDSASSQSWTTWTSSSSWLQTNGRSTTSVNSTSSCKPPVQIPVVTGNMKVLHLAIIKNVTRPAVDLCAESDLSSYSRFMRGRWDTTLAAYVDRDLQLAAMQRS